LLRNNDQNVMIPSGFGMLLQSKSLIRPIV